MRSQAMKAFTRRCSYFSVVSFLCHSVLMAGMAGPESNITPEARIHNISRTRLEVSYPTPTTVEILALPDHGGSEDPRTPGTQDWTALLACGQTFPQITMTEFQAVRYLRGIPVESITTVPLHADGRSRLPEMIRIKPSSLGRLRVWNVIPITVSRVLVNAADVDEWRITRMVLRVDMGPLGNSGVNEWPEVTLNELRDQAPPEIINPDLHPSYLESPTARDSPHLIWKRHLRQIHDAGGAAWVAPLTAFGTFQIDPNLISAVPGRQERLRAFRNRTEVPILREPNGRLYVASALDPNLSEEPDAVLLVDPPKSGFPSGLLGVVADSNPLRVDLGETTHDSSSAPVTIHWSVLARPLLQYDPKIPGDRRHLHWYWTQIGPREKVATLDVSFPQIISSVAGSTVTLEITGPAPLLEVSPFPAFTAVVNGQSSVNFPVGLPSAPYSGKGTLPANSLRPGKNNLTLFPEVSPDRFGHRIRSLEARWSATVTRDKYVEWVQNPGSSWLTGTWQDVRALPTIPGFVLLGSVGNGTVFFSNTVQDPQQLPPSIYWKPFQLSASPTLTLEPLRFAPPQSVGSRPEDPNLLMIGPSDFLQQGTILAQHRAAQAGLSTRLASVEAIAGEYGSGLATPEAVDAFLRESVTTSTRFALFLGESSDWPLGASLALPSVQPDLVPTWTAQAGYTHGDQAYSRIIGDDDFADLSVGRIPARETAEIQSVVERLIQRDLLLSQATGNSPPFLQVLDDDEEFEVAASEARWAVDGHPTDVLNQGVFGYVPNMRVEGRRRSRTASETLITTWTLPRTAVTFYGHGGPNLFSHERLLHLDDMPFLKSAPVAPVVACASCDNAWQNFPMAPVARSFAEHLVIGKDRASAVFGPTGGATSYEHRTLMARFVEGLLDHGHRGVGESSRYAANLYYARSLSRHVPRQYVLIGDPTMPVHPKSLESTRRALPSPPEDFTVGNPGANGLEGMRITHQTSGWEMKWGVGVNADTLLTINEVPSLSLLITAPENSAQATVRGSFQDTSGTVIGNSQILQIGPGETRGTYLAFQRAPVGSSATLNLTLETLDTNRNTTVVVASEGTFPLGRGANIQWVPGSGHWSTEGPSHALSTVFLHGTLINTGDRPSQRFDLQGRKDNPNDGDLLVTINELTGIAIPPLAPGEKYPVKYRWENAKVPGTHQIWLTANRPVQARESDLNDNNLLIPGITLSPFPNMRAEIRQVSPEVVLPGTPAKIQFEVSDSWPAGRGPVSVQFGFQNPLSSQVTSRTFSLPDLAQKRVINGPVDSGPEPVQAFAMVNADKDWEELDMEDSRSVFPVNLLLPVSRWNPNLQTSQSLAAQIPMSATSGFRHLPGLGLGIDPVSPGQRQDILAIPSHARSMAARPGAPPDDLQGQATWRFRDNTFQAASVSTPSDLVLVIPVSQGHRGTTTVSLQLELALGNLPGVSHSLLVQGGEGMPFVPVNQSADSSRAAVWHPAGEALLVDGNLHLRIRPDTDKEGAFGRIGVLIPSATATSPWFEIPSDWSSGNLAFQPQFYGYRAGLASSQEAYDSIQWEVRLAESGTTVSLALQPGPWIPTSNLQSTLQLGPRSAAFQWRLTVNTKFRPSDKSTNVHPSLSIQDTPILTDVLWRRQP